MLTLVKTAGIHFTVDQPFFKAHQCKREDLFILNFHEQVAYAHLSGRLDIIQSAEHSLFLSHCRKYIVISQPNTVTLVHRHSRDVFSVNLPEGATAERELAMIEKTLVLVDKHRGVFFCDLRSGKWTDCARSILLEGHHTPEPQSPVAFHASCAAVDHYFAGQCTRASRVLMFASATRVFSLQIFTSTFGVGVSELKHAIQLDYDSKQPHIVSQYDREGTLLAIVANSTYLFYTQLLLVNPLSGVAKTYKLHSLLTQSDLPCRSGKEQLWVDDLAWSPDNNYLALFLNNGYFCLFHRGGQPFATIVSAQGCSSEAHLISYVPFATETPHSAAKLFSVSWEEDLLLSDGFTLAAFRLEGLPTFDEMAQLLSAARETSQVSMGLSNLTKSLPSEIDDNKGIMFENILMLLKGSWSKFRNFSEENGRIAVLSHLEGMYQSEENKQEISYVNVAESAQSLDSSSFLKYIILSKKVPILEAFTYFVKLVQLQAWSVDIPLDSFEAAILIAEQVLLYTLSDGQAIYGYLIIRLLESVLGFPLDKLRSLVLVYTLVQYKNPQASNMNIIYYPIAFKLHRDSVCPELPESTIESIASLLNDSITTHSADSLRKETQTTFRARDLSDCSSANLAYIRDQASSFDSNDQSLCAALLRGNMQAARCSIGFDTFIVMAFFLDPTEPQFISPVEIPTVTGRAYQNVDEVYNALRALATIEKPSDSSYRQDAGFLYWVVGKFDKLESLLGPATALLAISSVLSKVSEKTEAVRTLRIMKGLFAQNIAAGLAYIDDGITDLFLSYGLDLLNQRIALLSCGKYWRDSSSYEPFESLALPSGARSLIKDAMAVLSYFYIDLTRLSAREWLKLKITSSLETDLIKKAKKLSKALWVLYQKALYHSTKDAACLIRLARFSPQSTRVRLAVLKAAQTKLHLDVLSKVVPLKYFEGHLNEEDYKELESAYGPPQVWKQDLAFSKFLYALFSCKEHSNSSQKKFVFPGHADQPQVVETQPEEIRKTWNYLKRTLFQEYGIEEVLQYFKGKYLPRKQRSLNLASLFDEATVGPQPTPSIPHAAACFNPIDVSKPRRVLEFVKAEPVPPQVHKESCLVQLACKELGIVLQKLLINRYLFLKDQIILGYRTVQRTHRKSASMPSYPLEEIRKISKFTEQFFYVDTQSKTVTKCALAFSSTASEGFKIYRFPS